VGPVKIIAVEADGLGEFIELGYRLHEADPRWVPSLRQQLQLELSGTSELASYAQQRLFVCEEGGQIVGRVAAIVNPRVKSAAGTPIGQLGYFECVDDVGIAAAASAAAASSTGP
jgi:hypothetical protein